MSIPRPGYIAGLPVINPSRLGGARPREVRETSAQRNERIRRQLLRRDGSRCWYCGEELGDDITIEHLTPKSQGGGLGANAVLAHHVCNRLAGSLHFHRKLTLRDRLRRQGKPERASLEVLMSLLGPDVADEVPRAKGDGE